MSTRTILQLTQAISLTGSEQIEAAQIIGYSTAGIPEWGSVRLSLSQLLALTATTGPTGVKYASPNAGENDNYTASGQMGPSVGFLELTPPADCNLTGLKAGFDGQQVTITNLSAFNLTLKTMNASSILANRFRMVSDFTLIQNDSKSFKYSASIGLWVSGEF